MPASPPNKRKAEIQQVERKAKRKFISTKVDAPLKRIPKISQRKSELITDYIKNEQNQSQVKEDTTHQLTKK